MRNTYLPPDSSNVLQAHNPQFLFDPRTFLGVYIMQIKQNLTSSNNDHRIWAYPV
jgi:hypothetical protein